MRNYDELDYLEEPDMFHDVFAHTPLLTNTAYTDFFHYMGQLACKYLNNENYIKKLQRLYWFTIEFGLLQSGDGLKIYGAGIISSKGETTYALGPNSTKIPFDLKRIFNHEFRTDIIQDTYYVVESFDQLANIIPSLEDSLINS